MTRGFRGCASEILIQVARWRAWSGSGSGCKHPAASGHSHIVMGTASSSSDDGHRTCARLVPSRAHAAPGAFRGLRRGPGQTQRLGMTNFTELASVPSDRPVPHADQLRLAVAAYLARFTGSSREHTESDLRCFLFWCTEHGLDPLAARR